MVEGLPGTGTDIGEFEAVVVVPEPRRRPARPCTLCSKDKNKNCVQYKWQLKRRGEGGLDSNSNSHQSYNEMETVIESIEPSCAVRGC
jgi:hypothetical protein